MPTVVLPVARPRRRAGLRRTALATMRAASRPTSPGLGFSTSSMSEPSSLCPQETSAPAPWRKSQKQRPSSLAEPANQKLVPVGAIKAQHIDNGFAFGGINQLTDAQQGSSTRNGHQLRSAWVGGRGIDFFVGVAELHMIIALEDLEKRFAAQRCREQVRKFRGRKITSLKRERLVRGMTQAFQLDDPAVGRQRKPRRDFLLVVNHFGNEDFRGSREAAAGHLLRVAHQFIEMNFGRGHEGADAAAALHDTFAFEPNERMARGHQADLVDSGQVSLGIHRITGAQMSGLDALANGVLNPLVGGDAITGLLHAISRYAGEHDARGTGPKPLVRCVIERSLAAIECTADSSARGLHFVDISSVELYSYALHNARTARPRRVSLREHFRMRNAARGKPPMV